MTTIEERPGARADAGADGAGGGGEGTVRATPGSVRSRPDVVMRRLLRLAPDGPRPSAASAQRAFGRSVWISATRCLLTYVILPVLGPVLGLTGAVGPVLGLVVGTVSMIAIVASMRRFWAAEHRLRWHYTALGGALLVLLVVQAGIDVVDLLA